MVKVLPSSDLRVSPARNQAPVQVLEFHQLEASSSVCLDRWANTNQDTQHYTQHANNLKPELVAKQAFLALTI
jgi:hypothetical protein